MINAPIQSCHFIWFPLPFINESTTFIQEQDPGTSIAPSDVSIRVEKARERLQDLSTMPTYRLRVGSKYAGAEWEETDVDLTHMMDKELGVKTSVDVGMDTGHRVLISGTLDPRNYNQHAWCHDTPGLESPQQVYKCSRFLRFCSLTSWPRAWANTIFSTHHALLCYKWLAFGLSNVLTIFSESSNDLVHHFLL